MRRYVLAGIPGLALRASLMQCMCTYVGGFQIQEADEYGVMRCWDIQRIEVVLKSIKHLKHLPR